MSRFLRAAQLKYLSRAFRQWYSRAVEEGMQRNLSSRESSETDYRASVLIEKQKSVLKAMATTHLASARGRLHLSFGRLRAAGWERQHVAMRRWCGLLGLQAVTASHAPRLCFVSPVGVSRQMGVPPLAGLLFVYPCLPV